MLGLAVARLPEMKGLQVEGKPALAAGVQHAPLELLAPGLSICSQMWSDE